MKPQYTLMKSILPFTKQQVWSFKDSTGHVHLTAYRTDIFFEGEMRSKFEKELATPETPRRTVLSQIIFAAVAIAVIHYFYG